MGSYGHEGNSNLDVLGRYDHNRGDGRDAFYTQHTSVGMYNPNKLGLYDTHGNIMELCRDSYTVFTSLAEVDPIGGAGGNRVGRGGCWSKWRAWECRMASRYNFASNYRASDGILGFRVGCFPIE